MLLHAGANCCVSGADKAITTIIDAPNVLQRIISNEYTAFDYQEPELTLIMGARCRDGLALVGDRKLTSIDTSGRHDAYDDKIRGELAGILTGFSGDAQVFQIFVSALKDYVTTTRYDQLRRTLDDPLMRLRIDNFGPSIEQVKLRISQLLLELKNQYENSRCNVLMGISGQHFPSRMSSLYYFMTDGRFYPISEPQAIGSGSPHTFYFFKRYWDRDKTMTQFAQLGDFLIRYISHPQITLDNAVGLNPERPYPQIVFIPDDPNFCCQYNNGEPKQDCTPTQGELEQYRIHSQRWLDDLHERPFYPTTVPS